MHRKMIIVMTFLCLVTTFIAAAANAAPQAASSSLAESTLKARSIARIEAYLSGVSTLKAHFTQVAPSGDISNGTFTLKRPGKMRWDYAPPSPILLVSDGKTFTYYDSELEQVNYIDVDDTLASFLARTDILLNSPAIALSDFSAAAGVIRVTVTERAKPTEGSLTLEFSDSPLLLRSMKIADASGNVTQVQFENAQFGIPVADSLFIFKDPRGVTVRKRD
jgi:outer membrane lipoprotein-sorting protein